MLLSGKEKGRRYTYDELAFLSSLSGVASIALKNSRMYEKAYYEARTDELTGLLNRKYFYETLERLYSENPSSALALIILNLDDFITSFTATKRATWHSSVWRRLSMQRSAGMAM